VILVPYAQHERRWHFADQKDCNKKRRPLQVAFFVALVVANGYQSMKY